MNILLSVDRHLGSFYFLAIMNNTLVIIVYKFLYEHVFSVLLGINLRVELLGSGVKFCFLLVNLFTKM